jgi:membrane carboxypeptidase/penicillin-binding protein
MTSLLRSRAGRHRHPRVVAQSQRPGRQDGNHNENVDAWFCGYNADLVGVAWIGFDQPKTLGTNETGANAALPIWISYMAKALKGAKKQTCRCRGHRRRGDQSGDRSARGRRRANLNISWASTRHAAATTA